MAEYLAPWQRYLRGIAKDSGPEKPSVLPFAYGPVGGRLETGALGDANSQYEAASLANEALGGNPSGVPSKGLVSRALDVITFLPSAAVSAVKEVTDLARQPFYAIQDLGLTEAERAEANKTRERVSLDEFLTNVRERNFAQEIFKELQYDKDAGLLEKGIKEALGFGIDIASTGGLGGGVKFGSVLGRKVFTKTVADASEEAFKKNALRLADETDEAFAQRAKDFGVKAATASVTGRSRAVREVFEEEFKDLGEDAGKRIFLNDLPKAAQGGVQVTAFGRTLTSGNAGGYTTDAVAKALRMPELTKQTDLAVKSFQNLKNSLRADAIKSPAVAKVVGGVNRFLNSVGQESGAWQGFVKAAVSEAKDQDIATAFRGFSEGVDMLNALRNMRGVLVNDTNNLFADLGRLKTGQPEAYNKAIDFMKRPSAIDNTIPVTEAEKRGLEFARIYRDEFERYHKALIDNGFDVGYLEEYLPLMLVQGDAQVKIAEVLGAGVRGMPGAGYRPEKERRAFFKDKIDPNTGKKVTDANGDPVKVPMTPTEVKDELVRIGRKDLADLIEDDPLVLLARYSTNVSRLIATKQIMTDLVQKGILKRSGTLQVDLNQELLQNILKRPKLGQTDEMLSDFATKPGAMGDYFEALNDELEAAYRVGDQAMIDAVQGKVDNLISSLELLEKKYKSRIRTARSNKNYQIEQQLKDEKAFLAREQAKLGAEKRGVGQVTPGNLAQDLANRKGIEYRAVGGGEAAIGKTFYLPQELAGLHGEKSLVDAIERTLLLRSDKNAQSEFMKSVDEYLQFFRTGATFGRLTGFVLRNGYGAVQNNFIVAGSNWADHTVAREVATARIYTDYGLRPFSQLTLADKANNRLARLAEEGRLTPEQTKRFADDLEKTGMVRNTTIEQVREEILKEDLSKRMVTDNISQWDVYQTAKQAGVYDRYTVLPASQGLDANDSDVVLLNRDQNAIVSRTDRAGAERKMTQKTFETVLNAGVGPETPLIGRFLTADVAGRNITIRPTRATRDLNQIMEEFARIAPVVTGLRKYGNNEAGRNAAGLLMKAAQFDYSNLTEFERRIMRRALPFYTYSKNNIPAMLRALLNDPERVRRNLAGWEAIGNVFADPNGDTYVLPDYVGEMYGFLINDEYRKKFIKDKPAWLQAILANPLAFRPETPALELERWTRGGAAGGLLPVGDQNLQEIVSSGNPLAKAVIQAVVGQNLFSGKQYNAEGVEAPAWFIPIGKILSPVFPDALRVNDKTGKTVTNERWLDFVKTILPQMGTVDRTALPVLEAGLELMGKDVNLSEYDSRMLSNLVSQFAGVNLVTITPETEQSELYNRKQRLNENIAKIAGDQGVSREKLRNMVNDLLGQGYDRAEILRRIEEARLNGWLAP